MKHPSRIPPLLRGMILSALILSSPILPVGISRAGGLGNDPAIRLHFAPSIDSIRAGIGMGLPAAGGRLFSASPKSLLGEIYLPLRRNGLLKELFVLLPSEEPLTGEDLAGIRNHLSAVGVTNAELESFQLEDETIHGLVEGMAVRFFPLTRIPAGFSGEEVLFLDPDFLLTIYRNEVKTPIVDLAWKLVVTLRGKSVRGNVVVLADLLSTEDASLRYAFLSLLLGEMVTSPSSFGGALPSKWEIFQQAETAAFFAQYPESMLLYRNYLEQNPKDASACYKIAMSAVRDLDDDLALHWLNKAAAVDPRFVRGFVTAADYLVARKLFDPAERVFRGGAKAFPKDVRMATSLAAFFLMRGERIRDAGDPEGAAEYFSMAASVDGADTAVRDKANRSMGPGRKNPQMPPR